MIKRTVHQSDLSLLDDRNELYRYILSSETLELALCGDVERLVEANSVFCR